MNLYCFSEPSLCGFYRTAACLVASNIPINSEEEPLDGNTKSNSPNLNISSQNDSGYSSLNLSGTTSLEGLVESDEIEITLESSLNLTQHLKITISQLQNQEKRNNILCHMKLG